MLWLVYVQGAYKRLAFYITWESLNHCAIIGSTHDAGQMRLYLADLCTQFYMCVCVIYNVYDINILVTRYIDITDYYDLSDTCSYQKKLNAQIIWF